MRMHHFALHEAINRQLSCLRSLRAGISASGTTTMMPLLANNWVLNAKPSMLIAIEIKRGAADVASRSPIKKIEHISKRKV
jgi:hypothetical protein